MAQWVLFDDGRIIRYPNNTPQVHKVIATVDASVEDALVIIRRARDIHLRQQVFYAARKARK